MKNIEKIATSAEFCVKVLTDNMYRPWCNDIDECEYINCESCILKWLDAEYKGETK